MHQIFIIHVLRAIVAAVITGTCLWLAELRVSLPLFTAVSALGVIVSGGLLWRGVSTWTLVARHIAVAILVYLALKAADTTVGLIWPGQAELDFTVYLMSQQAIFVFLTYSFWLLSTWCYWRYAEVATFEVIAFALLIISVLSAHRNFNLEAANILNELSWDWNIPVSVMIVSLGVCVLLLLGIYLWFSFERPTTSSRRIQTNKGRISWVGATVATILIAFFSSLLGYSLIKFYGPTAGQLSSGVGSGAGVGESPLGFLSAVGKTRQPAALVRFENEYTSNPWTPMLYLREGALSDFNSKEFVLATPDYDKDTPRISIGQSYASTLQDLSAKRETVNLSIYLITKHIAPFAIDAPTLIRPIHNPDQDRFISAYYASSVAPNTALDKLTWEPVGSSSWSKETWEHYLKSPGSRSKQTTSSMQISDSPIPDEFGEDLRYKLLAEQITKDLESPIEKVLAIREYLSQASLYTRSPGHDAGTSADPVAAYLFSPEKRGYCVHFAHAGAYLYRLAGVPSRIGTGYLTDLRYAKDGHVLLHIGDRHAWPEVYIHGYGWVVADITPARAENEQELIPDERLLEDLMSRVDPGVEFMGDSQDTFSGDENIDGAKKILQRRIAMSLAITLLCVLLAALVAKILLRYGYYFAGSPSSYARGTYRSAASQLCDLGIKRTFGQTHAQYLQMASADLDLDTAPLRTALEGSRLALEKREYRSQVRSAYKEYASAIKERIGFSKRAKAFCSIASLKLWRRL